MSDAILPTIVTANPAADSGKSIEANNVLSNVKSSTTANKTKSSTTKSHKASKSSSSSSSPSTSPPPTTQNHYQEIPTASNPVILIKMTKSPQPHTTGAGSGLPAATTSNSAETTRPHNHQSSAFAYRRTPTSHTATPPSHTHGTLAGTNHTATHSSPQHHQQIQNTIQIPTDATRTSQSRSSSAILAKKTAKDFVFQKVIGEGSFSMVCLANEIETKRDVAIKVCEKKHIRRYQKQKQIMREKELMNLLNQHPSPYFVKLFCTFQDTDRLFFAMTYAPNGELLPYIKKVGSFDEECTRFYGAEILLALEHLHRVGIIHRDLKPENILLKEDMHIMITDFGSACLIDPSFNSPIPSSSAAHLGDDSSLSDSTLQPPHDGGGGSKGPGKSTSQEKPRRASFDGTAQYVSPEMLTEKRATPASDLWAFGCIVYQMVAGLPPFHAPNEYIMFQKITRLEYQFPPGFNEAAKDLVRQLLILKYAERLGAQDDINETGYVSIKSNPFFAGLAGRWENLHKEKPPRILPYLPSTGENEPDLRSGYCVPKNLEPGLDEKQMTRLLGLALNDEDLADAQPYPFPINRTPTAPPTGGGGAVGTAGKISTGSMSSTGSGSGKRRQPGGSSSSASSPPTSPPIGGGLANSLYYGPHTGHDRLLDLPATEEERTARLHDQELNNPYHRFVEGNLILKQGLVDKRRGLFARRRMLLLTTADSNGPHLYYVDNVNMVLKGQIPWSVHLRTEIKNFKTFFVHTPNRTYYLEDPASGANGWCMAINEMWRLVYGVSSGGMAGGSGSGTGSNQITMQSEGGGNAGGSGGGTGTAQTLMQNNHHQNLHHHQNSTHSQNHCKGVRVLGLGGGGDN